jgi:DNA-binding NarL/FixJ family response regulator
MNQTPRVLLVDDHKGIREGMSALLRACDFEIVSEVTNGKAALAEAVRLEPDVVVMDITMPGLSGLNALPGMRARLPFSAIIIVTGHHSTAYRDEALRAGADAFVLKWRAASELVPAIHDALAARKVRARNQV